MIRAALILATTLAALAPPASAAAPRVQQMVVFRDGHVRVAQPSLAQTSVKVGGRGCTVPSATPLAALLNSRIGPVSIKDYGACSKRASDAASLFVTGIGSDRNKGSDGWVYKVGNVLGTAGAADPGGPLGRGRLRARTRVTWFWCHVTTRDKGCPHTLVVTATGGAGSVDVRVRRYDDRGKGFPAAGATVHAGNASATTGSDGSARLTLPAGRYGAWASQPSRIRSFAVKVQVR